MFGLTFLVPSCFCNLSSTFVQFGREIRFEVNVVAMLRRSPEQGCNNFSEGKLNHSFDLNLTRLNRSTAPKWTNWTLRTEALRDSNDQK